MNRLAALFTTLLAASPLAAAEVAPHQLTLDQSFAQQRTQILAALESDKAYLEISPDDRALVTRNLQQIADVLGETDAESFAALSPARQAQVISGQELVNQLLTQAAEDSRLVCVHQHRLGTRIRESVCLTKAERERFKEESRKDADDRLGLMRGQDLKTIGKPLPTPVD